MNVVSEVLCQTEWATKMEAELKNRLKAALIPTALHLKERALAQEQEIQATVTICDEILSVARDDHASYEDIMASPLRLQQRMRVDTTGVALASDPDPNLAGASFYATKPKRAKQGCAFSEDQGSICRHFCKHHRQVMDISMWEKLPAELVERICSNLPLSTILELVKLGKPMAYNFKQFCAKAHCNLFGILMYDGFSNTYRLAVSNSRHDVWLHFEQNAILGNKYTHLCYEFELVFGHDGGLISILPCLLDESDPLSVLVFNPLTGDKKFIPLSSSTSPTSQTQVQAILHQLEMNAATGCYKLILVTQTVHLSNGAMTFYSESYDSKSGVWSSLDSGFVFGDGVINNMRSQVYFDCASKLICMPDGQPTKYKMLLSDSNRIEVPRAYMNSRSYTFVRDHRFEVDYAEDGRNFRSEVGILEISESVQNRWNAKSTTQLSMEEPLEGFETRLLACQQYVLVVVDNPRCGHIFEHRHQRMVLYDRKTCKEVLNVPQFLVEDFAGDEVFMERNLHFMCDLKWDALP